VAKVKRNGLKINSILVALKVRTGIWQPTIPGVQYVSNRSKTPWKNEVF
jgi:hypothetical protein